MHNVHKTVSGAGQKTSTALGRKHKPLIFQTINQCLFFNQFVKNELFTRENCHG
jgi:hypothetical protein